MRALKLSLVGAAVTMLGLGALLAQPADTGGPGVRGPHTGAPASRPTSRPGTLDGGSRIGFPHLIPPFAAEKMKLTDDQRKQLDELAKEVKARLDKILTPEQQKILEEARPPHPEMGPGGPSGPGGPNGGHAGPGGPGGGPHGAASRPAGPPPPPPAQD